MRKIVITGIVLAALSATAFFYFRGSGPEEIPAPSPMATPKPSQEIIGASVKGRDIEAYRFPARSGKEKTHLVFVGGVHGGYEWNSVLLAYAFIDHLKANPMIVPEDLAVTVIPSANPDGVYELIEKEGRFSMGDVPKSTPVAGYGRFNANDVDLNRNFDCKWQPEATWRGKAVGAGTSAFSEPEARAIRDFVAKNRTDAVVFWHSQANAVYASECEDGILPETRAIMNAYSKAAGYKAIDVFDAYAVTGDAEGWLASIGIPAITVELSTHDTLEWEENLAGVKALFRHFEADP